MTETAIEKRGIDEFLELDLTRPNNLATIFTKSGFFPNIHSASQAAEKIMAGRELGLGAFASMQGIDIIQGKLRLTANVLASMVARSGKYLFRVREWTNEVCSIEFFEVSGKERESLGTATFSMADAVQAKLASKDNWKCYPRNMLWARAMSNGANAFCPDATKGIRVYTEGDFPDDEPIMRQASSGHTDELNDALEGDNNG